MQNIGIPTSPPLANTNYQKRFFATTPTTISAVNTRKGNVQWRVVLDTPSSTVSFADADAEFVGVAWKNGDAVAVLDGRSSRVRFEALAQPGESFLAVGILNKAKLVAVSTSHVYAWNAANGNLEATIPLSAPNKASSLSVVCGKKACLVAALDSSTGLVKAGSFTLKSKSLKLKKVALPESASPSQLVVAGATQSLHVCDNHASVLGLSLGTKGGAVESQVNPEDQTGCNPLLSSASVKDATFQASLASPSSIAVSAGSDGSQVGTTELPDVLSAARAGPVASLTLFAFPKKTGGLSFRVLVVTQGGVMGMLKVGTESASSSLAWIRYEGLAGLESAAFCELPEEANADLFGFNKAIVGVTSSGLVVGLTTLTNEVAWSHYLGPLGQESKLLVVNAPEVPTEAVVFGPSRVIRVDATSGAITGELSTQHGVSSVLQVPNGPAGSFVVLDKDGSPLEVVVSDKSGVSAGRSGAALGRALSGVVYTYDVDETSGSVTGYRYQPSDGARVVSWSFNLGNGAVVVAQSVAGSSGKIASPALVLPDESVLYRYINPHVFALGVHYPETSTVHVYGMDAVTGNVLVHLKLPYGAPPMALDVVDNGVVFSYFNFEKVRHEIGVADLFEPDYVDHSKYNVTLDPASLPAPTAKVAAFVAPEPIVALGSTRTRLGITSKQVLAYAPHRGIYSIPRRVLDGRRGNRKATGQGAFPYHYNLPTGLTDLVSYFVQVEGVTKMTSAPCELESHSLVLAHGDLDVFYTRVAPSGEFDLLGEEFQHYGLLLVLVALPVATLALKYVLDKKNLKAAWK